MPLRMKRIPEAWPFANQTCKKNDKFLPNTEYYFIVPMLTNFIKTIITIFMY